MLLKHSQTLSLLSLHSKVAAIADTCSSSLSPSSQSNLLEVVESSGSLSNFHKSIPKKRDNITNCARKLVMKKLVESVGSVNKAKKLNRRLSWRSLNSVSKMNIEEVVVHYKKNKVSTRKPPTETRKKVKEFYNRDCILRQLPYKNLTHRIKNYKGD